ncbi:hypothetical protein C8Q72DRAFT_827920 [Fomitopsis betulina]|nr:hypothetical protein C8Q72DRAFT_827920 [Fomitopsis betulina]
MSSYKLGIHIELSSMTTQQLCEGVQNLELHDKEIGQPESKNRKEDDICAAVSVSGAAQASSDVPSVIPPFHPSVDPQMSVGLGMMLDVPPEYTITSRPLLLGWPAPSEDIKLAIYNRYTEMYGREDSNNLGPLHQFTVLLRVKRHLGCREITHERCLYKHVVDPNSRGEMQRSFDCISIATTWQRRHRSGAKLTDDQLRWLCRYFGKLPAWHCSQVSHLLYRLRTLSIEYNVTHALSVIAIGPIAAGALWWNQAAGSIRSSA